MAELPFSDADIDGLFTSFTGTAANATYTEVGGSAEDVRVLRNPGVSEVRDEGGNLVQARDTLVFNRAEVADPARDATVVLGGVSYLVGRVVRRDDAEIEVEVTVKA